MHGPGSHAEDTYDKWMNKVAATAHLVSSSLQSVKGVVW